MANSTECARLHDPLVRQIAEFLQDIGIAVRLGELPGDTFLPGIQVERGALILDEARLLFPGDLLHEAGHLAVMDPRERATADADMGSNAALEMSAIAWSFAAARRLGIDPAIVFHATGYRGGSQSILENFTAGRYFGVPMLEWFGMTANPTRAAELETLPFPSMLRWLRE